MKELIYLRRIQNLISITKGFVMIFAKKAKIHAKTIIILKKIDNFDIVI